jgi:hypothetical protein
MDTTHRTAIAAVITRYFFTANALLCFAVRPKGPVTGKRFRSPGDRGRVFCIRARFRQYEQPRGQFNHKSEWLNPFDDSRRRRVTPSAKLGVFPDPSVDELLKYADFVKFADYNHVRTFM